MKKIFAFVLALVMVVSLPACGKKKDDSKLVIGIDVEFPPMGFRDENNEIVGFDIDLAKAVGKEMGVEVEFKPITWSQKEQELIDGNIDVIWNGYTITDNRKEKVDFTSPYLANAQVVVVKKDSAYNTLADLAGKKVAAQTESSALEAIEGNKEFHDSINLNSTYADNVAALDDVELGRIDALVVDKVVAEYYMAKKEGVYRILDEALDPEEYGVGVKKGNTELLNKIQKALDAIVENGEAAKISNKWFGADKVLSSKK